LTTFASLLTTNKLLANQNNLVKKKIFKIKKGDSNMCHKFLL